MANRTLTNTATVTWDETTPSQVKANVPTLGGDSGAGGTKGLVPAPAAGDAAASKFLKADGTWTAPSGSGDVVGPASVTDDLPAIFDGTTGNLLKQKTYAAFKTLLALVKGDVGLGSVDNTADAGKPVSTAQQTALGLKANLASPPLTGTPTAPTAAPGTNTTQLSTTAFVKAAIDVVLGGVSSAFDTLVEIVAGFIPNSLLTTRGDIIYRNASAPARLAKGTAGFVLGIGASDPIWVAAREVLTAARTYYVRADGSDSNTGLADTAGGAFLTVNKALTNLLANVDKAGFDVTIQVRAGTFAGPYVRNWVGGGDLYIIGDETTPANVVFNNNAVDGLDAVSVVGVPPGILHVRGAKLTTSGAGHAMNVSVTAKVGFQKLDFGAVASGYSHIVAVRGEITNTGDYTISAGAYAHINASQACHINISSHTTTLTGTPAFSTAFVICDAASTVHALSETWTGAATGSRYLSTNNGILATGGAGASYFPGNSAGAVSNGGLYL